MDLYNNELGRRIGRENRNASDEELAEFVYQAVTRGDAVVIDRHGDLAFSDQVAIGQTGSADDAPVNGTITPPEFANSN
jgi:hypothetical protein